MQQNDSLVNGYQAAAEDAVAAQVAANAATSARLTELELHVLAKLKITISLGQLLACLLRCGCRLQSFANWPRLPAVAVGGGHLRYCHIAAMPPVRWLARMEREGCAAVE